MTELGKKMRNTYVDFERWEKENEKRNRYFLEVFRSDLENARLTEPTIRRHLSNVDHFLEEMQYREGAIMEDSVPLRIAAYMSDEFIRRGPGSSESAIKSFAISMKKFTKSMEDHRLIKKGSYRSLRDDLEDEIDVALRRQRYYYSDQASEDLEDDDPDLFFSHFYGQ